MEKKGKVYSGLKRRNKFLGIIDYRTLVILLGYVWIVWKIAEKIFIIHCLFSLEFLVFHYTLM